MLSTWCPFLADAYAQRVANGWRPAKPHKMDPHVFELIEWCWTDDPNDRPQMSDIVKCLDALMEANKRQQLTTVRQSKLTTTIRSCFCFSPWEALKHLFAIKSQRFCGFAQSKPALLITGILSLLYTHLCTISYWIMIIIIYWYQNNKCFANSIFFMWASLYVTNS